MRTLLFATSTVFVVVALALTLALAAAWRRGRQGGPLALIAAVALAPLTGVALLLAFVFKPIRQLATS